MIGYWALYTAAVGLLLALAAALLERPLRERGLPVRWLWIACLGGFFLVPATALVARPLAPSPTIYRFVPADDLIAPATRSDPGALAIPGASRPNPAPVERRTPDLDRWLLIGWAGASGLLAAGFTVALAALRRRRRGWRSVELHGRQALISPDTGPAVVGAFPGTLVLPEWLLRLPHEERELILKHEEEHVRARDPLLLLLVLLLRIALPWNPALWWIGRSLRRAVEVDCDRRVLARGANPRVYARVLLDVSERGTAHRLTVAALSESPSFLERRIRLMIAKPNPLRGPRMVAAVALALAAAVAACQVDQPESQPIVATGFSLAPAEAEVPGGDQPTGDSAAVTPVRQLLPALPQAELGDSITAAFRAILVERHPEVISGSVRGDRINLYVMIDGNGDVAASAIDTEPRSGSCTRILEEGLGTELDRDTWSGAGCGGLDPGEAGPSRVRYFWSTARPATEQERLAPTGRYLFDRLLQASRPTREQIAAAVRQHFPQVYEEGLPQGETLWFVADRYHQVVHAGRGWEQPSTVAAHAEIQREIPGLVLEGGMMSGTRSLADTPISVYWARIGDLDSPPPTARPNPYPDAQTFAVSTPEAGRQVEIRLEGQAAADRSAFRISGKFTNDDGVLTATTPFSFIVMTGAPYRATLRILGEGEMQVETETEEQRLRMTARAMLINRTGAGQRPHILSADIITASRPSADGIPVSDPIPRQP